MKRPDLPDMLLAWIVGAIAIAHEDRLDLGTQLAEMGDAHRRPAREDLLAIGVRGGRQDRDARARSTGRDKQTSIESEHLGEEFTGADKRHWSGHGRESTSTLPEPRDRCDTGPT